MIVLPEDYARKIKIIDNNTKTYLNTAKLSQKHGHLAVTDNIDLKSVPSGNSKSQETDGKVNFVM